MEIVHEIDPMSNGSSRRMFAFEKSEMQFLKIMAKMSKNEVVKRLELYNGRIQSGEGSDTDFDKVIHYEEFERIINCILSWK